jgi:hypothetical protein
MEEKELRKETPLEAITRMAAANADAVVGNLAEDKKEFWAVLEREKFGVDVVRDAIYKSFHYGMSQAYRSNTNDLYLAFIKDSSAEPMESLLEKAKCASLLLVSDEFNQTNTEILEGYQTRDQILGQALIHLKNAKAQQAQAAAEGGPSSSRIVRPVAPQPSH